MMMMMLRWRIVMVKGRTIRKDACVPREQRTHTHTHFVPVCAVEMQDGISQEPHHMGIYR